MQGISSLRLIARNANVFARRNYGHGRKHPVPTMNDMPKPDGDFFQLYAKRQRKYNAILATGLGMFSFSLYTVLTADIVNFNWAAPDSIE